MSEQELLQTRIVELLPRLRRFARALTRSIEDADDLVQSALERALGHLSQWQPDTHLDSWMYRIVQNTWFDELRGRQRRERLLARDGDPEQVPDQGSDPVELLAMQQALQRLPPEQRLAVALVLIEGLPYREAAQIIGVPIGTLTSRLARGREALQALLEPGDVA